MGYGRRGDGRDVEMVGLTRVWCGREGTETARYSAYASQYPGLSNILNTMDETLALFLSLKGRGETQHG